MWRIILGILVGLGIFFWVDLTSYDKPDLPGTVKTNLTDLGFGPRKQLLIFEFDVDTIDMSDKKFMTLTWSDIDGSHTMPAGIEIKGSGIDERPKLNYAFEIWGPDDDSVPCTSIETCDDDKAELFQFGEDYEDYVLRGGYKEPTLVRDTIPSEMEGGILQHTLVEVVFKKEGEYFYEGVYILYPAIQRRVLEKRLDWDSKGKKEDCEDNPTASDIAETAFIGEYTNPGPGSRKEDCDWLKWIKMRYPKCDIGDCYHEEITKYFSVITGKNESAVDLDLDSFVDTFFVESLMMNGDFPISSQYFYKDPTGVFHSGPRWDYDFMSWRLTDHETWDFESTYGASAAPFWKDLGEHAGFIAKLNQVRVARSQANLDIALAKIAERRTQLAAGYFDRNIERWGGFDSKIVPYSKDMHLRHPDGRVKKTFTEELDFMVEKFTERATWMKENEIEEFDFSFDMLFPFAVYIRYTYVAWVFFLVSIGACLYYQRSTDGYEKLRS